MFQQEKAYEKQFDEVATKLGQQVGYSEVPWALAL